MIYSTRIVNYVDRRGEIAIALWGMSTTEVCGVKEEDA